MYSETGSHVHADMHVHTYTHTDTHTHTNIHKFNPESILAPELYFFKLDIVH